jgi:hypothetical protein
MRPAAWLLAPVVTLVLGAVPHASLQTASPPSGAKTWIGRHAEFEELIRTATAAGPQEKISVGVTGPRKVALTGGGPIEAVAWKPIRPGWYPSGFYESYKAEIAAYEIDKLIRLNMVPPTVEKRIGGEVGAAVMWVRNVTTFTELGQTIQAPRDQASRWNLQLVRAMMYDNLIGNLDPNLGNWLKDDDWNLILIDHSRSLTSNRDLYHQMNQIDGDLWDRMKTLDEPMLTATLSQWMGKSEIRAVLQRRERMQQAIDRLIKDRGAASVVIREP